MLLTRRGAIIRHSTVRYRCGVFCDQESTFLFRKCN